MQPTSKCELCGEPMPSGEEMFKFHGYSGPCPKPPLLRNPETDLEAIRRQASAYGDLNAALHDVAAFALDLTLSAITTDGVPQEIRKRAFATHRRLLAYRDKYTLRSRGEIDRGHRDTSIDNPNCNAFGESVI